jgi:hypothetical protein
VLNDEDKAEILALFPDRNHILDADTPNARPNISSLMNDDNFRYDCARYTENLSLGRHDPEWLEEAYDAHEMRKAGEYDDYLAQSFEESWGIPLPDDLKPKRDKKLDENHAEDSEVENEQPDADVKPSEPSKSNENNEEMEAEIIVSLPKGNTSHDDDSGGG